MNLICKPKCSGKTTEIIKIASDSCSYIVCINQQEAERISQQAKEMRLDIPFPITMDDFINGNFYGKRIKGFVIDNIEFLLSKLSNGIPIKAISMTETIAHTSDKSGWKYFKEEINYE